MKIFNKYNWKTWAMILPVMFGMGKLKAQDKALNANGLFKPLILNDMKSWQFAPDGKVSVNLVLKSDVGLAHQDFHMTPTPDRGVRGTSDATVALEYGTEDDVFRGGARVIADVNANNQMVPMGPAVNNFTLGHNAIDLRQIEISAAYKFDPNTSLGFYMGNATLMGNSQFAFDLPAGAQDMLRYAETPDMKIKFEASGQDEDEGAGKAELFIGATPFMATGKTISDWNNSNVINPNKGLTWIAGFGLGGKICPDEETNAYMSTSMEVGYTPKGFEDNNGKFNVYKESNQGEPFTDRWSMNEVVFVGGKYKNIGLDASGTYRFDAEYVWNMVGEVYYDMKKHGRISVFGGAGQNEFSYHLYSIYFDKSLYQDEFAFLGIKYSKDGVSIFVTGYNQHTQNLITIPTTPNDYGTAYGNFNGKSVAFGASVNLGKLCKAFSK
ncbi:MAG: hypothetical protein FWC51_03955 [Proteobacteria bacterium]|nr:hypothetical protein [Pseudomonadota bacterium]